MLEIADFGTTLYGSGGASSMSAENAFAILTELLGVAAGAISHFDSKNFYDFISFIQN